MDGSQHNAQVCAEYAATKGGGSLPPSKTDLVSRVRAAQAGDAAAFRDIYERFQGRVFGLACRRLRDFHLAEDIVQEAFIEAYQTLPRLREPAAFPHWLQLLVAKHCDRHERSRCAVYTDTIDLVADDVSDLGNLVGRQASHFELKDCVEHMPRQQRVTTALYLAGYTLAEIARLLEEPLGTIKKRLHDARSHLRRRLGNGACSLEQISTGPNPELPFAAEGLAPTPSDRGPGVFPVAILKAGKHAAGMALDPVARRLYVANERVGEQAGSLSVFDLDTWTCITTVVTDRRPWAVAHNPSTGRLYLTHYFQKHLAVLDASSVQPLLSVPLAGNPVSLAVDSVRNRLYVMTLADGSQDGSLCGISAFDGETHAPVAIIPIGPQAPSPHGPASVSVDLATGLVYATRGGLLCVIDGPSGQVEHESTGEPVYFSVVHPLTHRVYLSLIHADLVQRGVGVAGDYPRAIQVDHSPLSMATDPGTDRLYVSHGCKGSISVVCTLTDQLLGVVPVTRVIPSHLGACGGMQVDPSTHRNYLTYQDAGLVLVLQDGDFPVVDPLE